MAHCLIAIVIILTAFWFHPSHAQNAQQDYLNVHNNARAGVGVSNIVWDTTVANYAQNYANARISDCALTHSGGTYGENLAKGSGLTGTAACNMWVAEGPYYDYATNTCAAGKVCGHYTQVVWNSTVKVGCGRARCTSGSWYVVCSYDPPGNIIGQRPY